MAILAKKLQPAKTAAIEETKKVFAEYNDFIFTEYRGLTVEQISALRDKLREHEAPMKVVKNNFARVAFEEMKIEDEVHEIFHDIEPRYIADIKRLCK